MACFKFRFFFDPGSGTCLWSANDFAHEEFGYAVNLDQLGLPEQVQTQAAELLTRFDTSIDWSNPGGITPWSSSEHASFDEASAELLESLRESLPIAFEITTGRAPDRQERPGPDPGR